MKALTEGAGVDSEGGRRRRVLVPAGEERRRRTTEVGGPLRVVVEQRTDGQADVAGPLGPAGTAQQQPERAQLGG